MNQIEFARKEAELEKKQKEELQIAFKTIEEQQKELKDSIHYAKRIQTALLASDNHLNSNLENYFIFFQPKDIVSGDFYWACESQKGEFIFLTADSTGHGVPGAIMSLLNIMSQIGRAHV